MNLNKLFGGIANLIFAILMIIVVPLVVFMLFTAKSPLFFGIKSAVVLTGSMEPTIPAGSVLFTYPGRDFSDGDIVMFKSGDVNVTHRIVKTEKSGGGRFSYLVSPLGYVPNLSNELLYTTKGDANNVVDGKQITKNQIVGKALFHIPYVGKLSMSLKSPGGFILLIVLPTMMFILYELWGIKKEIVKNTEKKILERIGAV